MFSSVRLAGPLVTTPALSLVSSSHPCVSSYPPYLWLVRSYPNCNSLCLCVLPLPLNSCLRGAQKEVMLARVLGIAAGAEAVDDR